MTTPIENALASYVDPRRLQRQTELARHLAEMLGDSEGAKLLRATLGEEAETDQKLTKLAKSSINVAAAR